MQASWASEMILLGLLCERPMHGYELGQLVRNDPAMPVIWRFERSEVYFLLGKLRERGYVVESAPPEGGQAKGSGPMRTIYAPTEAGRRALDEWLRTPELRPRLLRTAFLARVHLALRRDPQLAVEIIEAQQGHLASWLAQEREAGGGGSAANEYVRRVLEVRASQVEASIRALDGLADYARSLLPRPEGAAPIPPAAERC